MAARANQKAKEKTEQEASLHHCQVAKYCKTVPKAKAKRHAGKADKEKQPADVKESGEDSTDEDESPGKLARGSI